MKQFTVALAFEKSLRTVSTAKPTRQDRCSSVKYLARFLAACSGRISEMFEL